MSNLADTIYKELFPPDGAIPLKARGNLLAIESRIKEIQMLADGQVVEGMNRRLNNRSESLRLTMQIAALRDSCDPPMSYREILKQLGAPITPDAARSRYDKLKKAEALKKQFQGINGTKLPAAPAPSQVETEEHSEEATVRNCRPVEEHKKVKSARTMTPSEIGKILGPKIPHDYDEFIFSERSKKRPFKEILLALHEKGVECRIEDLESRYYTLHKEKDDELKIEEKKERVLKKSDLPSLSRAEVDDVMWKLYLDKKSLKEIAEELEKTHGVSYSIETVRRRLLNQGAKI
jgi:hypothetical protein